MKSKFRGVCILLLMCMLLKQAWATSNTAQTGTALTGFNSKWSYIPRPDNPSYDKFINHVKTLNPTLLRYPGGTITHRWDWKKGAMTKAKRGTIINPIEHLTELVTQTNTDIVFVLDIIHHSLQDQIEMLKASNIPVKYIEIGNEIYSKDYEKELPSGKDYAVRVNSWIPELRKHFPNAKLSVSLLGRDSRNPRHKTWNKLVSDNVRDIDAYTYHIYVREQDTVAERIKEYEQQLIQKDGIDIWITEYGIKNEKSLTPQEQSVYIQRLDQLRRYVEGNSQIALCHILITKDSSAKSNNFSAIRYGGKSLNPVGVYFKESNDH